MNCRINTLRIWETRLELEARMHSNSAWATFTYDEQHLPDPPEVSVVEMQKYVKRLRKAVYPRKIRYFIVGEYGGETLRPHYHAVIFGMDGFDYFNHGKRIRYGGSLPAEAKDDWAIIYRSWNKERISSIGPLSKGGARYNLGYITKKLTRKNDPMVKKILGNKHPEFSIKSRSIGGDYAKEIGKLVCSLDSPIFPIQTIKKGRSNRPVGRHLTNIINESAGKEKILQASIEAYKRAIHQKYDSRNPAKNVRNIIDDNKTAASNQEYRFKLRQQKRSL